MCQHIQQLHPIFCIVPPYVLDEIAQRGTPVSYTHLTLPTNSRV